MKMPEGHPLPCFAYFWISTDVYNNNKPSGSKNVVFYIVPSGNDLYMHRKRIAQKSLNVMGIHTFKSFTKLC